MADSLTITKTVQGHVSILHLAGVLNAHSENTLMEAARAAHVDAGLARLIKNIERPNRLVSFGDWESLESIQVWRGAPEFAAFPAKARGLCDDIQTGTFKVAALAG